MGGKLPDYITAGSLGKQANLANVPPSAFGDPGNSSFPCHTRDSAFLSQLYFYGGHANGEEWTGSLPREKVAERLDDACEYWGILDEVGRLKNSIKLASALPELTDDDYALVEQHHGATVRRFPVINAEAVKMSSANFFAHKECYPYPWRQKTAQRLLEKAAEFTATEALPEDHVDYFMKACGFVPAVTRDVAVQVMYRAQIAGNEKAKLGLEKLACALRDDTDTNPRNQLCGLIDTVDRNLKLFNKYASGLPMPEEICFQTGIQKEADAVIQVALNSGTVYALGDIKKAGIEPYGAISNTFAAELAADDIGNVDLEKVAEILPTLPRDQAILLDKAFEATGVPRQDAIISMHVKSAAVKGNIDATSLDQWYKFAQERGDTINESFKIVMHMNHPQRVVPLDVDDSGFLSTQHAV